MQERVYLRMNFSLTKEYKKDIDDIKSVLPKAGNSDVIKAALDYFNELSDQDKKERLVKVLSESK